jgi:putative ABC transport system permease protein
MRDLRRRWPQVLATALVIAIGIAVFAGLGGMRQFREESAQRSFDALKFHDLRVTLPDGTFARAGAIRRAATAAIGPGAGPAVAQERLLANTQIDGKPIGKDVLTPGLIVGVPLNVGVASGGRGAGSVDAIRALRGRTLRSADTGKPVAVLDRSYANFYKLPATGRLNLAGGTSIDYVGQGQSPQYFLITSETGFGGESTLGVLYTSLETAQKLAARPGEVNELVMRLRGGADAAAAKRAIERSSQPALAGATVMLGNDEQSHTILFRDAKNDQRMLGFFGLLVLLGASIAAFNLVGRTVEAERREIGIGMALGVPAPQLALRPLLLGTEIALTGTLLGALLSVWLAHAYASIFEQFLPLPEWGRPFHPGTFARGAAVGFLLPFAATVWPVWRGVRVQPVEAIRVSARSARGGMVRAATRVRLPGGTVAQMPWRNSSRTPRRTLLAVIGLGAVIGSMIALVGIVDSFNRTIDQSRAEIVGNAPGRLNVALSDFQPARSRAVRALAGAPGVARTDARLDLPGTLLAPGKAPVTVFMTINESPASGAAAPPVWTPTIQTGHLPTGAGEIAIAPKAATDLGVKVGGAVTLRVAGRGPGGATKVSNLKLRISGLTTDPFRVFAYADQPLATRIGMAGIANALSLMPAPGAQSGSVQRALASSPIVATTRPVTADSDALSETIDQFKGIIQVAAGAAFVLAVLMAFNIAGISLEERRREYATMFAFGLPVGRGLRIAATENLIVGVLGTALGLLIGRLTVNWIINSLFADTWPEIGMVRHLSAGSAAIAVLVGVVAVAATPYLLSRRLTRMDLPSTLRVVE